MGNGVGGAPGRVMRVMEALGGDGRRGEVEGAVGGGGSEGEDEGEERGGRGRGGGKERHEEEGVEEIRGTSPERRGRAQTDRGACGCLRSPGSKAA